jgi:hypothetical protein
MKRYILAAFLGLAVFGATVKASVVDQVVVTIPFEFVVAGKTLPAGPYRVDRVFWDRPSGLVLNSLDSGASSVSVFPSEVESVRSDKIYLSFEQIGDQHFLSKVKSRNHVFNIEVPRAATLLASKPSHTAIISGSAGTN